jgi:hypothetical protein
MKKIFLLFLLVSLVFINIGCKKEVRTEGNNLTNNLTAGMAKSKIVNGVTSQSQILADFGSPNIVSKNKSGNEVWTYDKIAIEKSASDGYWNVIVKGEGWNKQITSTKTFTLMIEFDGNGIVQDSNYRASQF